MFRLIGYLLKVAFVTALILVLGQIVRWEGRTVSDQIKTRLAKAEKSPIVDRVSDWAESWVSERGAPKRRAPQLSERPKPVAAERPVAAGSPGDGREIPPSERQKLRELIRELNGRR